MKRSRPVVLVGAAWAALGAAVVGALLPLAAPLGEVVTFAVLLIALVSDWAAAAPPARVDVERRLPASLTLGETGELGWEIGNRSRRRAHIALADSPVPSLGAATRRAYASIAPGARHGLATTLTPSRRGELPLADIVVRTSGPLRIAGRQASRPAPAAVRVLPPFRSRREAELRIERARLLEVGLRSAAGRGGGTEFEALRDYTVDDESRRIDWAATARAGHAVVRTYRAERNQQVVVALDTGRTMAGRVAGVPRVEHAIDAAMALVAVATGLGDRAGLLAYDAEVRAVVTPSNSRAQLARVVDAVYRLEPELVESDPRRAFTELLVRFRRRAMLVLLSELSPQAVEETLLPHLPVVTRTHLVVVGAVRDPQVEAWAASTPRDGEEAYRKAAALTALADRRAVVARLGGLGATVVDAAPGELAPRLADAYLAVKATGRL